MNRRTLPAALASLLLLAACATAPPPAPPAAQQAVAPAEPARWAEPLPFDPDVIRGTLPNGISYYIRRNGKPEKRAELRLAVNAGSVLETEEQRGLAHFVEHMAFNGTEHFAKQELVNYLERIGMHFGPEVNAYTGFDETLYMLHVPTDDPAIVDTAFRILDDWASAVSFDPEEVEKERGVLVEEWRLGRGAAGRIRDKEVPIRFHGSRYAERLPIGKKEVIESAPVDVLEAFYRTWYRPDLMAVIAVGDFDPAAVEALIRERFGDNASPGSAPARAAFDIPDHEQTLVSSVTDPEATGISVQLEFKRPPVARKTIGDMRRSLVDSIYHGMMNQRLQELSRAADPPFQYASAGSGPMGRTRSAYRIFARVNDGGAERGLRTILTEARRVEEHGFLESELERAKASLLRSVDRMFEERDKQESARFASQYAQHFLEEYPAVSIAALRDLYYELVPGVTLDEVNARAAQWITDTNRVILVNGPETKEAGVPGSDALLAVFEEVDELGVTPWVDRVRDEPLVAAVPAPGKIVTEETIASVGVTKWTLANGPVVLLKPTDFKNDEIVLRGFSRGGDSLAPDATYESASRATEIAGLTGLGNFDRTELGKALTGKVASVSTTTSGIWEAVRGTASPRDLETMFQLLYLRFTTVRRDEEAFASYLTNMRGQLQNQESSPEYVFARKFNEVITRDHPRRRFMTLDRLGAIRLDDALAFHRERYADASDFLFTIVGSFDVATMRPLVEQWIGALPSIGRKESWRNEGIEEPPGVHRFVVEKGIEPKSSVRIVFHGNAPWSFEEQRRIGALADVLRMRLREELREDLGGVYGVGVGADFSPIPEEEYSISVGFSTSPERVDELIATVFSVIDELRTTGPDEDHAGRVREGMRRARERNLKQNGYWSYWLEYYTWNGIPYEALNEEWSEKVAAASLRDSARKYLDPKQYVLGVLKPEGGEVGPARSLP